jgi:hypothetical protein
MLSPLSDGRMRGLLALKWNDYAVRFGVLLEEVRHRPLRASNLHAMLGMMAHDIEIACHRRRPLGPSKMSSDAWRRHQRSHRQCIVPVEFCIKESQNHIRWNGRMIRCLF